jgi:hypothetical protein
MFNRQYERQLQSDAEALYVNSQLTHDTKMCRKLIRFINGPHIVYSTKLGKIRKNFVFFMTKEPEKVIDQVESMYPDAETKRIDGGVCAWRALDFLDKDDFYIPLDVRDKMKTLMH